VTLADDSGLCIDALGGRPGVYSARYSGPGTDPHSIDQNNNKKVLGELAGMPAPARTGRYNCTVAIYDPVSKFVDTVTGLWEGRIALEPRGQKSFGYAPIFLPVDLNYEKTSAELEPEEIIAINHRGRAFRAALAVLREQLFSDGPRN
jgi:XTP/dITP diphosphohydrolase